ncbi:hypothetical protein F383_03009 [Gossypium arboreum]|uniref:Uncharacterized protein n=1 Tax=Gossypium arboreum TaxID=29729 RepID=A0A0B0NUD3_GOSAR|nr:hypothetical protein F383_03009 [Gossypium arboreum]
MGQRTKSTRLGLPHMGRPHGQVPHGRVPVEPKFIPIRKKPILRVLRHSKAYKYILEEEERRQRRRQGTAQGKPINPSQKQDSSSRLKIFPQFPFRSFGILIQVKLLFRGGIDSI